MTVSLSMFAGVGAQFSDDNGAPLAGGLVYVYLAGGTTPTPTYQTSSGSGGSSNSNPIILDSAGRVPYQIWLTDEIIYKFVLKTSGGSTVRTEDNIYGASVNRAEVVTTFAELVTASSGTNYIFIDTPITCTSSLSILEITFGPNGKLILSSGTVLTITRIADVRHQIFDTTAGGGAAVNLLQPWVRPEWWGDILNSLNIAVSALPSTGGIVKLASRRYKPNGHVYGFGTPANAVGMFKDNITLEGEKMPRLSDNCQTLTGGTIIEGMYMVYANNVELKDLGVDSGKDMVDSYAGGVIPAGQWEGLILTFPDDVTKAASAVRKNARLHNVIGLSYSPTSPTHAMIAGEGYKDVNCSGEIVGCYGTHGVVVKCSEFRADSIVAYLNAGEGVIFKTDAQASAIATNIQVDRIDIYAGGPSGFSPYATTSAGVGFMLNPQAGNIGRIQIGSVSDSGHAMGMSTNFGGAYAIDGLQIGSFETDGNSICGLSLEGGAGSQILRSGIGQLQTRNTPKGIICNTSGTGTFSIGSHKAVNCTVAVESSTYPALIINSVEAVNCSDAALRLTYSARPLIGVLTKSSGTPNNFSSTSGGLVPALINGWTQFGGTNDAFDVQYVGGSISITGLLVPGTSNAVLTVPFWAVPVKNKRFIILGNTAGTIVAIPAVLDTTGTLSINETAGGFANCTSWLSLEGVTYSLQ